MRGGFSEEDSLPLHYALVYAPKRERRKRFPENCVQEVASREAALEGAKPEADLYPARLAGPSRSSEGFRMYYLVEWL